MIENDLKRVTDIGPVDFRDSPVWEYDEASDTDGEVLARRISERPIIDAGGRFIGVTLTLANKQRVDGVLSNVELWNPRENAQFLSLTVYANGKDFSLARYFDPDVGRNGPAALAAFLRLSIDDVFPIRYDLSGICLGAEEVIHGSIPAVPAELLTQAERIQLIVKGAR